MTPTMQTGDHAIAAKPVALTPEILGRVISVRGSQVGAALAAAAAQATEHARVTVGKFLGLRVGRSFLIGVVTNVALQSQPVGQSAPVVGQLDLIGEIRDFGQPSARFQRGVSTYPAIGDAITLVDARELRLIFQQPGADAIEIGGLQLNPAISAYVDLQDMLSKHFAVLGTTGVGKSSAVALILQQILRARPKLRMLVLDVHNEYGRCFEGKAQILNPGNVKLPFWLFNFEEIVDVFFGGRPGLEEEIDILAELIPLAKSSYSQPSSPASRLALKSADALGVRYTVDIPVPYRIADLLALLDARMGKLENRSSRMVYHKLITRIEAACNDPRYAFMFENANVGGDTMAEVLSVLFRLPPNGMPMTIMQLAGFPSEVVDAVVSVTCRMAFDLGLWSDGTDPLLIICEEAHRYMSFDHTIGFGPTRRAISRIAKEGRKYGVFLGLVTQRPAELDPTILSQCSTLFAMRMTNDRDQALLRSSVTDTASNLLDFLPSLGTGEAFAFGEGVALPTRVKFKLLPAHLLPRSMTDSPDEPIGDAALDQTALAGIIERWRGVSRQRPLVRKPAEEIASPAIQPVAPATERLDPDRFRLLKRPVGETTLPEQPVRPRF